jgi:rubrerythrin
MQGTLNKQIVAEIYSAGGRGRRSGMSIQFNADEIFEMAEQIERNGARFYRQAAEGCAQDERSGELLLNLASMEDDHEKTFHQMRKSLSDKERGWEMFDPHGQAAQYLQAFAGGHVFNVKEDACDRLSGTEKLEDILRIALGMEKDSIVFYQGIREMVPERMGKEKIENIIREEMKHITILNKELVSLKA